ncbi:MAG TPA: GNAT family N-acetyltransferase [Bryobacteraceae bacterium]|jgi:phosphinothricin acetyltransferase
MSETVIRESSPADIQAISQIYAHHVLQGTATFELDPPDEEEISRRRSSVLAEGLPYLVAESGGRVAGYAYAGLYRPRPAYRFTIEDSIYLHPDHLRKGIGRLLLAELIRRCEAGRWRQMIAVIGDSGNLPSIRLHESMGFRHTGTFQSVGWKFGRWLDTVLMQRPLGTADQNEPA